MNVASLNDAVRCRVEDAPMLSSDAQLHVWHWTSDDVAYNPKLLDSLDDHERERYARLVTDQLKVRFAVSHAGMRRVLAKYVSMEESELRFEFNGHGKPRLLEQPLCFNLTHSSDHNLLAISQQPVGIDCEQFREVRSRDALASKHFSSEEQQYYSSLSGDNAQRFFFRTWARNEAVVKYTGLGLSASVRQLNTLRQQRITLPATWETPHDSVVLHDLPTTFPIAAAVAMQRQPNSVELFRLVW